MLLVGRPYASIAHWVCLYRLVRVTGAAMQGTFFLFLSVPPLCQIRQSEMAAVEAEVLCLGQHCIPTSEGESRHPPQPHSFHMLRLNILSVIEGSRVHLAEHLCGGTAGVWSQVDPSSSFHGSMTAQSRTADAFFFREP